MLALLVGVGNSIGMLGAVLGQGPLSLIIEVFDWRNTMVGVGIFGLVLAFVLFFVMRQEGPTNKIKKPAFCFKKNMKKVCKNKQTWINALVGTLFYTATVSFGGLWAIPYLSRAFDMTNSEASFAASMIYVGWIIAGPIVGFISDRLCNRKIMLQILTAISCALFLLLLYLPNLSAYTVFRLMFALGVALSGQLLCYTLSIELNSPETKGTALAFTNFLVFFGGAVIQPLVGWMLDWGWAGKISNNLRFYSTADYQVALVCFPIALGAAFVLSFFVKEKIKPWCTWRKPRL